MIDWVFLDVGNVLFNDDPQNFEGYRLLFDTLGIRHPRYSFAEMMAEREERAPRRARISSCTRSPSGCCPRTRRS